MVRRLGFTHLHPTLFCATNLPHFDVESIVGRRMVRGKIQYKVKWLGYRTATWEPEELISVDAPDALQEFLDEERRKRERFSLRRNPKKKDKYPFLCSESPLKTKRRYVRKNSVSEQNTSIESPVKINGAINFQPTFSLLNDGSDLPLNDVNTMRYYYNLGIKYYRQTIAPENQSTISDIIPASFSMPSSSTSFSSLRNSVSFNSFASNQQDQQLVESNFLNASQPSVSTGIIEETIENMPISSKSLPTMRIKRKYTRKNSVLPKNTEFASLKSSPIFRIQRKCVRRKNNSVDKVKSTSLKSLPSSTLRIKRKYVKKNISLVDKAKSTSLKSLPASTLIIKRKYVKKNTNSANNVEHVHDLSNGQTNELLTTQEQDQQSTDMKIKEVLETSSSILIENEKEIECNDHMTEIESDFQNKSDEKDWRKRLNQMIKTKIDYQATIEENESRIIEKDASMDKSDNDESKNETDKKSKLSSENSSKLPKRIKKIEDYVKKNSKLSVENQINEKSIKSFRIPKISEAIVNTYENANNMVQQSCSIN